MNLKLFATVVFLIFFSNESIAQKEQSSKLLHHELGVQANQLLRQLINLSDDDAFLSNPYLLTYSVFGNCKWGVQLGGGYFYNRIEDKFSQANHESKLNDFAYRAGIARYFNFGKKWYATVGLDYAGRYIENKTATVSVVETPNISIDSTTSNVRTIEKSNGGGIQLRLGFKITEMISLSTEATFYYFDNSVKSNVLQEQTITSFFVNLQDSYTLSSSNSDVSSSDFTTTIPVAIFLNINF